MCSSCPAGEEPSTDKTHCEFCEVGKYRDDTMSVDDGRCRDCPTAKIQGQTQCCNSEQVYVLSDGTVSGTCQSCDEHEFVDSSTGTCQECPANFFGVGTVCSKCPKKQNLSGLYEQTFRMQGQPKCTHAPCKDYETIQLETSDSVLTTKQVACFFLDLSGDECDGIDMNAMDSLMRATTSILCTRCNKGKERDRTLSITYAGCVPCRPGYVRGDDYVSCTMCPSGQAEQKRANQIDGMVTRGMINGAYHTPYSCQYTINVDQALSEEERHELAEECYQELNPTPKECAQCPRNFKSVNGLCMDCAWNEESSTDGSTESCITCAKNNMVRNTVLAHFQRMETEHAYNSMQRLFNPIFINNPDSLTSSDYDLEMNNIFTADNDICADNFAACKFMNYFAWRYSSTSTDTQPNYAFAYANLPEDYWPGQTRERKTDNYAGANELFIPKSPYIYNQLRVCCSEKSTTGVPLCSDLLDNDPCHSENSDNIVRDWDVRKYTTYIKIYSDDMLNIASAGDRCSQFVYLEHRPPISGPYTKMTFGWCDRDPEHPCCTPGSTVDCETRDVQWCDLLPEHTCCMNGLYLNELNVCMQCARHETTNGNTPCTSCPAHYVNLARPADNRNLFELAFSDNFEQTIESVLKSTGVMNPKFGFQHIYYDRICIPCPVGYHTEDSDLPGVVALTEYPISNTQTCVKLCGDRSWSATDDPKNCEYELNQYQEIQGTWWSRKIGCRSGFEPDNTIPCYTDDDIASQPYLSELYCTKCKECLPDYFQNMAVQDSLDCQACNVAIDDPDSNYAIIAARKLDVSNSNWHDNTKRINCNGPETGKASCRDNFYSLDFEGTDLCVPCPEGFQRDATQQPDPDLVDGSFVFSNLNDCVACPVGMSRLPTESYCTLCPNGHYAMQQNVGVVTIDILARSDATVPEISRSESRQICVACEEGYTNNADYSACVPCTPCDSEFEEVTACGSTGNHNGRGEGQGYCQFRGCPPGYKKDSGNTCTECDAGTYMDESDHDNTQCKDCTVDMGWSGKGASSCKTCPDEERFKLYPAYVGDKTIHHGYVNESHQCQYCDDCFEHGPIDSYKQLAGVLHRQMVVSKCQIERYHKTADEVCRPCPLGTWLTEDQSECKQCDDWRPFTNPRYVDQRLELYCQKKVCVAEDLPIGTPTAVIEQALYFTPEPIHLPIPDILPWFMPTEKDASDALTYSSCQVMTACHAGTGLVTDYRRVTQMGGIWDAMCTVCPFNHKSSSLSYPAVCEQCAEGEYSIPGRSACNSCRDKVPSLNLDLDILNYVMNQEFADVSQYFLYTDGFFNRNAYAFEGRCLCSHGFIWSEKTETCESCSTGFYSVPARSEWPDDAADIGHTYELAALYPYKKFEPPATIEIPRANEPWVFIDNAETHEMFAAACRTCAHIDNSHIPDVPHKWSTGNLICRCDTGYAAGGYAADATRCAPCEAGAYGLSYYVKRDDGRVNGVPAQTSRCEPCQCGMHQQYDNVCGEEIPPECVCEAGAIPTESDNVCEQCPAGKYQFTDVEQTRSCVICEAGKYNDKIGQTECTICPQNHYCPAGSTTRSSCDATRVSDAQSSSIHDCHCQPSYVSVPNSQTCALATGACPPNMYAATGTESCTTLCEDASKAGEFDCTNNEKDLLYHAQVKIGLTEFLSCADDCADEYLKYTIQDLLSSTDFGDKIPAARGFMSLYNSTHLWYVDKQDNVVSTKTALAWTDYSTTEFKDADDSVLHGVDLKTQAFVEYDVMTYWTLVILPKPLYFVIEDYAALKLEHRRTYFTEQYDTVNCGTCSLILWMFANVRPSAPSFSFCPFDVNTDCTGISETEVDVFNNVLCYTETGQCGQETANKINAAFYLADFDTGQNIAGLESPVPNVFLTREEAVSCSLHPQSIYIAPVLGAHIVSHNQGENDEHSTLTFGNSAPNSLRYWRTAYGEWLAHARGDLFAVRGFVVEFGSAGCTQTQRRVIVDLKSKDTDTCTGTLAMDATLTDETKSRVVMAHVARCHPALLASAILVRVAAFSNMVMGDFSTWQAIQPMERICLDCPLGMATESGEVSEESDCSCPYGYIHINDAAKICHCCKCDKGFQPNEDSICVKCPPNTYKSTVGDDTCKQCDTGFFSTQGATQCVQEQPTSAREHIYPLMGTPVNTRPLVLCQGYDNVVSAVLQLSNTLYEDECFAIDSCQNKISRWKYDTNPRTYASIDVPFPAMDADGWTRWFWRGEYEFGFSGIDSDYRQTLPTDTTYSMYKIEYARVPLGVTLETCIPDFGAMHSLDLTTISSVSATELQRVGIQCMQNTHKIFEGNCADEDHINCITNIRHDSDISGTTQLFRYKLSEHYYCKDQVPNEKGRELPAHHSSMIYPYETTRCPQIENGDFTTSGTCDFTCNDLYSKNDAGTACESPCGSDHLLQPCSANERTISECTTEGRTAYECKLCLKLIGKGLTDVTRVPPSSCSSAICKHNDICQYEDCSPNTFNNGTFLTCQSCPVNEYSSARAETCIPCARNEHRPLEVSACTFCLTGTTPVGATCEPGFKLYNYIEDLNIYFGDNPNIYEKWDEYCTNGYACLPCEPGTYEDSGECKPCEEGKFNSNYAQTICTECGNGLGHTRTGERDPTNCACEPGYGT